MAVAPSCGQIPSPSPRIRRTLLLWTLAAGTGVIAGLCAYLLLNLIGAASNLVFFGRLATALPSLVSNPLGVLVLVVPAFGGLLVGLMARYGTPKIKGHGIPEAMEAILTEKSRVAARVAILKPLSVVIAIGTGGPFGAEGPIIQTGGALGSLLGQLFPTTASERKVLLSCGAAGGMAAVFGTPIAAVILVIELLLFEYRTRSLVPLIIASAVATTVRSWLIGTAPLFSLGTVNFDMPQAIPLYVTFGVLCGAVAIGVSKALFAVEDAFERLRLSEVWHPALGGLGLGLIGYFFPRVLGVGYGTINALLHNSLPLQIVAGIAIMKTAALLISLGSGTSGGLLAPLFMAGAALGVVFAAAVHALGLAPAMPSAFAVIGMAAIFGSAARAPFALTVFAFEITHSYEAILPLMLSVVIATGFFEFFMRTTIMTEKLARRGLNVPHGSEVDSLETVTAAEVLKPPRRTFRGNSTMSEVSHFLALEAREGESARTFAPILDDEERLLGVVTPHEALELVQRSEESERPLCELMRPERVAMCRPEDSLRAVATLMLTRDVRCVPVSPDNSRRNILGYITLEDMLEGHRRWLVHELER